MKIYLCSKDLAKQINITGDSNSFGHKKRTFEKGVFLWPEHFHKTSLLPQAFLAQKKKQEIETLIIIDRIINREGTIKIKGHINRSGTSFLRAETPHKERPTFPDMSKIYKNKAGETVITVGPERFVENNKQKNKDNIRSPCPYRGTVELCRRFVTGIWVWKEDYKPDKIN